MAFQDVFDNTRLALQPILQRAISEKAQRDREAEQAREYDFRAGEGAKQRTFSAEQSKLERDQRKQDAEDNRKFQEQMEKAREAALETRSFNAFVREQTALMNAEERSFQREIHRLNIALAEQEYKFNRADRKELEKLAMANGIEVTDNIKDSDLKKLLSDKARQQYEMPGNLVRELGKQQSYAQKIADEKAKALAEASDEVDKNLRTRIESEATLFAAQSINVPDAILKDSGRLMKHLSNLKEKDQKAFIEFKDTERTRLIEAEAKKRGNVRLATLAQEYNQWSTRANDIGQKLLDISGRSNDPGVVEALREMNAQYRMTPVAAPADGGGGLDDPSKALEDLNAKSTKGGQPAAQAGSEVVQPGEPPISAALTVPRTAPRDAYTKPEYEGAVPRLMREGRDTILGFGQQARQAAGEAMGSPTAAKIKAGAYNASVAAGNAYKWVMGGKPEGYMDYRDLVDEEPVESFIKRNGISADQMAQANAAVSGLWSAIGLDPEELDTAYRWHRGRYNADVDPVLIGRAAYEASTGEIGPAMQQMQKLVEQYRTDTAKPARALGGM